MNVIHPSVSYLKFILGGKDNNKYPGFNGLFTKIIYSHKEGVFIDELSEFKEYLESIGPNPKETIDEFLNL